ncbi:phytanoyl-CoA dioxygenase [Streptomyces himastatinicus ATCC 53653]|uniref:Phytanoyl-CoA dioxygenase n=1 Tax=Streptomyces himastatinicus ATCC 53653 TaxID=457427 RepID=D9WAX2_9ACTN|nr:phytanoyl-CoA dioxygenase family protein [Streptomyces himastatinicus]EFL20766.1 phytanoyl-CoA dioxygenase [Streptomyces himastatinicus ATCC 53653]
MAIRLARLPASSTVAEVSAALDRDGGVIVEDLIDKTTLRGLWDDLGPALEKTGYGDSSFAGHRTKRLCSLFARSRHMEEVALNPLFLGAARDLIERPVPSWFGPQRTEIAPNVQVSITQVIQIWPGETPQPAHRDDIAHMLPSPGPTNRVQIMLAMDEFTDENGATMVYPGSHAWEAERGPRPEEAVQAEMEPGSCLIWVGGLFHGGGPNLSDDPRTGLTMALVRGNLRQEENQFLAVPKEIVREYPEELQRLLGWGLCPPFIGWYEHADPNPLLRAES